MKKFRALWALMLVLAMSLPAKATGWPANYQGVMLQGFYWDSYDDTKWTNLTSQADELSQYFSLIWIPNSASCGGGRNMGYMPIYWFTHHTTIFGTEDELLNMISTFKEKGTGFIADVVINHRNGVTNWWDFPKEEWNGKTYQLTTGSITSGDEVWRDGGHGCPASYKGGNDTGDDFGGARDLDHTNATVQENCKAYTKCLLDKYGYAGFRYDMVKGYSGSYTKMYNQYSKPRFSVGEYWDGQYDAVKAWIDATGKESAAFDFPCKYAINEAFSSNDMSKLAWKANGTTNQPAGMIHYGYQQYSVTFIDNHDTYRDGSKFNGNVLAANAFILASPGTPCIFLAHWKSYKSQLKKMIAARNNAGVTNTSSVTVLKAERNCYMAVITGTNGKLAVRIGSTNDTPAGFTDADIKASGTGYCIWSTAQGGEDPDPDPDPDPLPGGDFKVYWDNTSAQWATPYVHYWGGASESTWPGIAMENVSGNTWSAIVPEGTTGLVFNANPAPQTKDYVAQPDHIYDLNGDNGLYQGGSHGGNTPSSLYILGDIEGVGWVTTAGKALTRQGDRYVSGALTFTAAAGESLCYFNLTDAFGADWDELNAVANRYGAATEGETITLDVAAPMQAYLNNVDASGCKSWAVTPGVYYLTVDFKTMTVTLSRNQSGIATVEGVDDAPAVYYTLQGVRVDNPSAGLYIVVRGNAATKQYIP